MFYQSTCISCQFISYVVDVRRIRFVYNWFEIVKVFDLEMKMKLRHNKNVVKVKSCKMAKKKFKKCNFYGFVEPV